MTSATIMNSESLPTVENTSPELTVPLTAILADAKGERVQVVRNGVVETRPVRGGLIWQGRREVLEGLKPGEQVVARAGALDLEHIGPVIGQHLPGPGAGQHAGEVEHLDAREGAWGGGGCGHEGTISLIAGSAYLSSARGLKRLKHV